MAEFAHLQSTRAAGLHHPAPNAPVGPGDGSVPIERPTSVGVLGWIVVNIGALLVAAVVIGRGFVALSPAHTAGNPRGAVTTLVQGAILVVIGSGILKGRRWAAILFVVLGSFPFILMCWAVWDSLARAWKGSNLAWLFWLIAVPVACFYILSTVVLLRPRARQWFRQEALHRKRPLPRAAQ